MRKHSLDLVVHMAQHLNCALGEEVRPDGSSQPSSSTDIQCRYENWENSLI